MRAILTTHYLGAHTPTVLAFESEAEAQAFAEHVHKVHAGVTRTIIQPVAEDEVQDKPCCMSVVTTVMAAVVATGWFFVELGRLL